MKLSLKLFVIIIPAIVACIFARMSYNEHRAKALTATHFDWSVRHGLHANPELLLAAWGRDACAALMDNEAYSPDTQFDGSDRWCQIIRVPDTHGQGQGDEFTLFSLSDGFYRTRTLPEGGILKSIALEREQIVFSIYGDIGFGLGGPTLQISEDEPVIYRFPWKPGTRPPEADLSRLLSQDARSNAIQRPR